MKAINIVIAVYLSLSGQQEPISRVATIKTPANFEHISALDISRFEKTSFKYVHRAASYPNRYKVGDILLGFEDFQHEYKGELDLNHYKDVLIGEPEEVEKKKIEQTSYMVKYNDTPFVLLKASQQGENFYYFCSETKGGKGIRGTIQFKDKDSKKAKEILEGLLKSIKLNNDGKSN